jgi:hypothetical protein
MTAARVPVDIFEPLETHAHCKRRGTLKNSGPAPAVTNGQLLSGHGEHLIQKEVDCDIVNLSKGEQGGRQTT